MNEKALAQSLLDVARVLSGRLARHTQTLDAVVADLDGRIGVAKGDAAHAARNRASDQGRRCDTWAEWINVTWIRPS